MPGVECMYVIMHVQPPGGHSDGGVHSSTLLSGALMGFPELTGTAPLNRQLTAVQ